MMDLLRKDTMEEVVRGVTEEVRRVSSVTYDLTLVCKGGATVRKIYQNRSCHQSKYLIIHHPDHPDQ